MRCDLAIIIVEHDCADLLRACLRSLVEHTRTIDYRVLVVSNGVRAPDVAALEAVLPTLQVVRAPQRASFAAATNLGLQLLPKHRDAPRYVVLLNPDTYLHDDALGALVRYMDLHPQVGAAGPQLRRPDGTPQPYSHGAAPTPGYLLRRLWSQVRGAYLHPWSGTAPLETEWVAATCMIVRYAALQAVGPLDERFGLYFEDVDWCLRLRAAGWRVLFVPTIAITHLGGASIGARATQHYDRALVRWYAKRYGGLPAAWLWWALRVRRALGR